jgi:hypothetical protein
MLGAFSNAVNALSGKRLDQADADILIVEADAVIGLLGGERQDRSRLGGAKGTGRGLR